MKLYIRGTEYAGKLLARSLRITKELADSSANFSLLLDPTEIDNIDITNEVEITDTEVTEETEVEYTVFGGVVNELEYENYRDKIRLNISCASYKIYANRFYVDETVPIDPKMVNGVDRNVAGEYVKSLITKYLMGEGIRAGDIQDGAVLTDNVLSDYFNTTVYEILDAVAEISSFKWFVDGDKRLNFAEILKKTDRFSEPVTAQNPLYREIVYRKELTDFRNKQILIGSEPVEDIPDENYDPETGKLRVEYVKQEEVDRLKDMNGGSGIWGNLFDDSKIVTLADASKLVDKLINDYGTPPALFEFKTDIKQIDAGDSFVVDIPFYGLNNRNFIVESVEIEDYAVGELLSTVKGNLRETTTPRTNLFDWLKNIRREINNVPKLIERELGKQEDPGDGVNRNGLISWIDATDSSTIAGSGGKVLRISDKNGGGFHVAQPYDNLQPSIVSMMGSSFLEFDGTQYMGFQNNIPNARTVFVVYQDLTIDDYDASGGTLFIDGQFVTGGTSFQGGDYPLDNNVFNSSSMEHIYKAWVNSIQMSPGSVVRYRDNFAILSFTLDGDLSVDNLFKSENGKCLKGRFAELLIYNRVMSNTEIDDMNMYLYNKHFN